MVKWKKEQCFVQTDFVEKVIFEKQILVKNFDTLLLALFAKVLCSPPAPSF